MKIPCMQSIDFSKKRVFLRADLNIPLNTNNIQDHKLKAIVPTINYIQDKGGKVILATHIGRPPAITQKNYFDESLSTKKLIPWFEKQNYTIEYEIDLYKAINKSHQHFDRILLLENLRFFNGEKETNYEFAQLLAQCGDIYINDAFALLHRNDTSTTLLAKEYTPQNRSFGLLVQKEIETLQKLKKYPSIPFVITLGGSKIKTKIKFLESLLKKQVKTILIGGKLANIFLKAQGKKVGSLEIDEQSLSIASSFLQQAQDAHVEIILPTDVLTVHKQGEPAILHDITNIPPNHIIVDIGPRTIELFKEKIMRAKTIFANGVMGIYENKEYQKGTLEVFTAIAQSHAYSVVGGGDAVAAIRLCNAEKEIDFLSTGGGATIAFLASKEPLKDMPGLQAVCGN